MQTATSAGNKSSSHLTKEYDGLISKFKQDQVRTFSTLKQYEKQKNMSPAEATSNSINNLVSTISKASTRSKVSDDEIKAAKKSNVIETKNPGFIVVLDNEKN